MSKHFEINGNTLIPLRDAARKVSYSRDYLAKLAREEKIIATQVGRQWFIDLVSLQNFIDGSALEQEVRNQYLREERRRELIAKKETEALAKYINQKRNTLSVKSLIVASVVVFLGLFTGVFIDSSVSLIANYNQEYQGSDLVAQVVNEDEKIVNVVEQNKVAFFTEVLEYPLFVDEAEVRKMENLNNGIVLFTEGGVENIEEVKNIFSDNVEVKFLDSGEGIVGFSDQDGEIRNFSFLNIPKNEESNDVPERPSP